MCKITTYYCDCSSDKCIVNEDGIGSCGAVAEKCIFRGDRWDMKDILIERWNLCFEAENKHRERGEYQEAANFDARRIEVESIMRRSSFHDSLPGMVKKVHKRHVIEFGYPDIEVE